MCAEDPGMDRERPGTGIERLAGPVNTLLGDTGSEYVVLPRVLLQSMPLPWQARLAGCLDEMRRAFAHVEQAETYIVQAAELAAPQDMSERERRTTRVSEMGNGVWLVGDEVAEGHTRCVPVPILDPLPAGRRASVLAWPVEPAAVGS
jgi:hypothetical protein